MKKKPDSQTIGQLVARNNKLLDSITPLLQTINDIGNTPEINVAISSMFQSITGGINQLGVESLQKLLQQVNQLFSEQNHVKTQDASYVELLNKSCTVIRQSLNAIQQNPNDPQIQKNIHVLLKEFNQFHERIKAGEDTDFGEQDANFSEEGGSFDSFGEDDSDFGEGGGSFDSFSEEGGSFDSFGGDDAEEESGGSFDSFSEDGSDFSEEGGSFDSFGGDDAEEENGGSFDSFGEEDTEEVTSTLASLDEGGSTFFQEPPIQKPELFIQKSIDYFEKLEHKLVAGSVVNNVWGIQDASQKKISQVVADDGLAFDEPSIKQGLILCQEIQKFLSNSLGAEQLQLLKSIFPFYRSPEGLLDYIKVLFAGDIVAKEQSIRVYASKIIGTYNVIFLIRKTPKIFDGFADANAAGFQKELQDYAELPLKRIKNLLPRKMQEPYTWNRQTLKNNICKILATRDSMFSVKYNRNLIVERFREFVFHLMCDPGIFHYLAWKHQYLKYWLYTELHEMDTRNLTSGKAEKPQYALAKIAAYQKLGAILATLEGEDRSFDQSKQLDKTTCQSFRKSENYLASLDPYDRASDALADARAKEKVLLDSLNIAQLATLAENVHQGIATLQSEGALKGEIPEAMRIRSIELGNHAKMEKACQASVLKVQWRETKKFSKKLSQLAFATLRKVSTKLSSLPKGIPQPTKTALKKMPGGKPLPRAEVEWVGFGKEVRSEIYTPQMPNLQLTFFEHKRYQLFLYPCFQEFIQQTIEFYKGHGYLKRVERPYIDGKIKEPHIDEAIYLKVKDGSVVAFGETFFKRPNEPTRYFQVFHKKPVVPVEGSAIEWFNRHIDGNLYCMESFETPNTIRPVLFRYLVSVIESLPNEMKHHKAIHSLHEGLQSFAEMEGQLAEE